MHFDVIHQAGSGEREPKIFERRCLTAQARIRARRRGMRIDRDHLAEVVAGGDGGEADRGFALEAADLEDDALAWGAGGCEGEEPGLSLGQEAGGDSDALPRFVRGGPEVWR